MSKTTFFGFAIRNRNNNYYAIRRFGERVCWVALGKSLADIDIESKIRAYCLLKGLDLTKKPRVTKKYLTEKISELEKVVFFLTERVRLLEEYNMDKLEVRQEPTKEVSPLDATAQPLPAKEPPQNTSDPPEVAGQQKVSCVTMPLIQTARAIINTPEVVDNHKISGFRVRKNKKGYYIANRGKVTIDLGSSLDKAQEKIDKYLSQHPEKKVGNGIDK